jgi:ADP-ribose pyrophosphatase
MSLPALPETELTPKEDARVGVPGFLWLRRQHLVARYANGEHSEVFTYDSVERTRLDAVIIAAHFSRGGERHVFLRSAIRPSLLLRSREAPVRERATLGSLWELPAGLVELDEQSPEGLRRCAARELHEELGFTVAVTSLAALGPPTFPAPGMVAERQFFFHVEVDPAQRETPPEDGSPLERHASIAAISLREALDAVRSGEIEDAKSEIALRRLAEV